jgi:hypothetical protein
MKNNWNLKNFVYTSDVSVEEITSAIRVFETLKVKYPNDELIDDAIDILRDEICKMYGGTIYIDEI